MNNSISDIKKALRHYATSERAQTNARFFKTEPGHYGHGDKFLGVSVPDQRIVAKRFYGDLSVVEAYSLLKSPWHEERLTALLILVLKFQRADLSEQTLIVRKYIKNAQAVNNWDLVDSSASYILGSWLLDKPHKLNLLTKLAHSSNLWERRIAIIATQAFLAVGQAKPTLMICDILKYDQADLIQKAYGWTLREMGKRVNKKVLLKWLEVNAHDMPRTALRYALEHFNPSERAYFMNL